MTFGSMDPNLLLIDTGPRSVAASDLWNMIIDQRDMADQVVSDPWPFRDHADQEGD